MVIDPMHCSLHIALKVSKPLYNLLLNSDDITVHKASRKLRRRAPRWGLNRALHFTGGCFAIKLCGKLCYS